MTDQLKELEIVDEAMHDRQVRAVMSAIAKLTTNAAPQQITSAAVFEGAIKGGAIAILANSNATADDIAEILENFANSFRNIARPCLHVVQ